MIGRIVESASSFRLGAGWVGLMSPMVRTIRCNGVGLVLSGVKLTLSCRDHQLEHKIRLDTPTTSRRVGRFFAEHQHCAHGQRMRVTVEEVPALP